MPDTKEWTLMFYFASDNPLGPTIVSQLKALKQAGFHPAANIVAYYDPPIPGTPAHVFEVNITEKVKADGKSKIGFRANDSWVHNLVEDKLWGDQKSIDGRKIKDLIAECLNGHKEKYAPPDPPSLIPIKQPGKRNDRARSAGARDRAEEEDVQSPATSLGNFLQFCRKEYPARNYMLFILGHGLVVGNDVFLYDDSAPEHSLSLKKLGVILDDFKQGIGEEAEFQLISFHSCSMSSLEVAYELKGTANYMLAAQCPTSVGNWPYKQILIRVLNDLERGKKDLEETLSAIFDYCVYNSYDFQLAGYSFDLCLCDLRNTGEAKEALNHLSKELIGGLSDADSRALDLTLLAHWDAQSYWGEMYTDLYDFCFRLQRRCLAAIKLDKALGEPGARLNKIGEACQKMIDVLAPQSGRSSKQLIMRSSFVGPAYQYAHGLSVYFPWSEPLRSQFWENQYSEYKLIKDENKPLFEKEEERQKRREENPSWQDFLQAYFRKTMRDTRAEEQGDDGSVSRVINKRITPYPNHVQVVHEALDAMTFSIFARGELGGLGVADSLGGGVGKVGGGDATGDPGKVGGGDGTGDPGKVGGGDGTGGDFYYSTMKNYPPFTRAQKSKPKTRSAI